MERKKNINQTEGGMMKDGKHKCCMYGDKCQPATIQITTRKGGKEWYCDECAKVSNASMAFRAMAELMKEEA